MRKPIWGALIVLGTALLAAVLFAWSGLYNVAASSGHWAVVSRFLQFGMEKSIRTYAIGIHVPPLTDPALAERGMLYFQSGCAPCHGAPGVQRSPIALQMLPPPPELSNVGHQWSDAQLFRIVKHGLKYTGMPAWPAPSRDDEIWALVAFLRLMPHVAPAEYRARTRRGESEDLARSIAHEGLIIGPFACASCHGVRGEGSPHGGVPRLAGQKASYLEMALEDFATAIRPSGMMAPPAVQLDNEQRSALARYYSSIKLETSGQHQIAPLSGAEQRAVEIVLRGKPSQGIPACQTCHGINGRASDNIPQYPALTGQHADYLDNQLRLFRAGKRGGRLAEIMSASVRNLTDDEIEALAFYYSKER